MSQESPLKQWTRLSLLAQRQRLSTAFPAGNRRFPTVPNNPPVPQFRTRPTEPFTATLICSNVAAKAVARMTTPLSACSQWFGDEYP
jgi:hypothetical protein